MKLWLFFRGYGCLVLYLDNQRYDQTTEYLQAHNGPRQGVEAPHEATTLTSASVSHQHVDYTEGQPIQ